MPVFQIVTNNSMSLEQKVQLTTALASRCAEIVKTPVTHVHVHIQDAQFFSFGGDHTTPAAYVICKSSALQIGEEARKTLMVSCISPLLTEFCGCDPSRTTTFFADEPVEHIAVGSSIMVFSGSKSPTHAPISVVAQTDPFRKSFS